MKISYLHLRNYKQFSDLELDLTYPAGHAKAGQPLDKICIIGQSGTGKTNLLDVIKKSAIDFSEQPKDSYLPFSEFVGKDTDDRYIATQFNLSGDCQAETLFTGKQSKITFKTSKYELSEDEKNYFVSTDRCGVKNVPTQMVTSEFDINSMSISDRVLYDSLVDRRSALKLKSIEEDKRSVLQEAREKFGLASLDKQVNSALTVKKTTSEKIRGFEEEIRKIENKYTPVSIALDKLKIDNFMGRSIVNINESDNSWKLLKARIDNYEIEKTNYTKKLSNKLLSDDNYSKEDYKKDMALWEKENENILDKIADDLNSILQKFNLQLQINEATLSYEELIIKDLSNGGIIGYDDLSTGTKNLLSTFIPLKSYKPKDSIILIDEPEMSFYPDIQRQLIDLYMSVGENNQLIVATHSPLIASSFEPWEVVELKFDAGNQIYREKYYEGDNHVDHYTVDPRMLTWTGILTDVFDLQEDSNFSFREKKLMEYATLKAEIKSIKDKASKEAEVKIKQFKKLSALLGLQN